MLIAKCLFCMQNVKKLRWSIPFSIALIAITASLGVTPILVSGASSAMPHMSVVPAVSSVPDNGGTDFTVYVVVPEKPPVSGNLFDLRPAFVVQSISQGLTSPDGTVSAPYTFVTCETKKTSGYPGYPDRNAETKCTGFYEQRVDPRAYWGSNTAIFFLGLVGFSPGTWTINFVVTGLYYGNTITLTASAKIQVGSTTQSMTTATADPTMSVVPVSSSIPANSATDFTVYVQVPDNPPVSGTFYDLQPAFVVQSISEGDTDPTGLVSPPSILVTCTTNATNKYPGYPSRVAETACSQIYEQRVDPRAYWGSNTGIYFLGLFLDVPGTWTITFIVTGLYYGNSITLTATAQVQVG